MAGRRRGSVTRRAAPPRRRTRRTRRTRLAWRGPIGLGGVAGHAGLAGSSDSRLADFGLALEAWDSSTSSGSASPMPSDSGDRALDRALRQVARVRPRLVDRLGPPVGRPDGAPDGPLRMRRRLVGLVPRTVPPQQPEHADRDEDRATRSVPIGTPKNSQLSSRNVSSRNRVSAVPDEEDQQQVARSQSFACPESEVDQEQRPEDAADRLVQEQRVEPRRRLGERRAGVDRQSMRTVDGDAPRQRRRRPVQLLVEVVAPPTDGLHHEQGRCHDVRPPSERHAPSARVPPGRQRAGDDATVHAETRVRRQDDRDRVVGVQVPLVDDVVEPAADQRRDGDDDDPVARDVLVLARAPRQPDEQEVDRGEADRVAEAVPADAERADGERDRIRRACRTSRGVYPGRPPTSRAGSAGRSLYFAAVNAEFNWWLLIVGLVVGAGLVWLVVLDSRRREADVDADGTAARGGLAVGGPRRRGLGRPAGGRRARSSTSIDATSRRHHPTRSRPSGSRTQTDPSPRPRMPRRTCRQWMTSPQSSPTMTGSASSEGVVDLGQ